MPSFEDGCRRRGVNIQKQILQKVADWGTIELKSGTRWLHEFRTDTVNSSERSTKGKLKRTHAR
jgi:hypothetical protein